jgi:hypothetical protein
MNMKPGWRRPFFSGLRIAIARGPLIRDLRPRRPKHKGLRHPYPNGITRRRNWGELANYLLKCERGSHTLTDRQRFHALYGAPLIHLALIAALWIGALVPPLRMLTAYSASALTLIDLPFVTFGTMALTYYFHYEVLAIIWQIVAGSLWWYFLSWLLFRFRNRKVQDVVQSRATET